MRRRAVRETIKEHLRQNFQSYYRFAYSYVQDPELAMEIVEDSAYRAVRRCAVHGDVPGLDIWLYQILFYTSTEYLHRLEHDRTGEAFREPCLYFDVMDSLGKLDAKGRATLILACFEHWESEKIAAVIGETSDEVKRRIDRSFRCIPFDMAC